MRNRRGLALVGVALALTVAFFSAPVLHLENICLSHAVLGHLPFPRMRATLGQGVLYGPQSWIGYHFGCSMPRQLDFALTRVQNVLLTLRDTPSPDGALTDGACLRLEEFGLVVVLQCPECGSALNSAPAQCTGCNKEIIPCPHCGGKGDYVAAIFGSKMPFEAPVREVCRHCEGKRVVVKPSG